MAQSNEGQKEPMKFPNANQGQGTSAKANNSVKSSKSVPKAASIFKGPKQESYTDLMDPNKKAGDFPG